MAKRRVVVTGLGLVTPLGCDVQSVWKRLLAGHSGVVSMLGRQHQATGLSYADLPSQVAALVPTDPSIPDSFNVDVLFSKGDERKMAPFMLYAKYAAARALADARWTPISDTDQERTGICMGSGIGCMDDTINLAQAIGSQGLRRISPYLVPRLLINMAAGHISIEHKLKGPNHAVSTACATGAHAIGDAMRFIQYGDADVMVAGGTESAISPVSMAGFAKARSLSTRFNAMPTRASRPFDRDRDGFVMGEGAGVVVLEELDHALRRGAPIYAEMRGYGLSGDAFHMTAPPDNAEGAARAMKRVLEISGLTADEIDYINAHATSTEMGDLAETRAIKSVFGDHVTVSSTKGAIGHLLGAAGSVEAIFSILAVYSNMIPATLNLETLDPISDFSLDYVALESRNLVDAPRRCGHGVGVDAVISNSFGFGGTNASLCFSKLRV
ncbi:hypothetical protein BASA50_008897 [Batrachochytrium salamandrivorans]|uniref:3-oxoacyl-[acyl-carrier-protein] synthase n=1 Tax=Batrachochytrium salamandrivorans TaxID=1357716 RepID=A0ABQ8F288_9FUNG|nr:hypothetical protein BASA50_008897 [Batrachochytrium salamandrivorans]KAH6598756.1 hypothetical protein BASA61_002831 [Batrachochytrium salamandrivorans]KAH9268349.1 beta-ketoacyl-acyl-carrier-protein synthase II [Batrachochytrium salamandrivorans]